MRLTPTQLRNNVYSILDQIINTGIPIEVERHGEILKIIAVKRKSKIANLKPLKNLVNGDPADFAHIDWTKEWKHDLS